MPVRTRLARLPRIATFELVTVCMGQLQVVGVVATAARSGYDVIEIWLPLSPQR